MAADAQLASARSWLAHGRRNVLKSGRGQALKIEKGLKKALNALYNIV